MKVQMKARVVDIYVAERGKYVTLLDKETGGQGKLFFPAKFNAEIDDLVVIDGEFKPSVYAGKMSLELVNGDIEIE